MWERSGELCVACLVREEEKKKIVELRREREVDEERCMKRSNSVEYENSTGSERAAHRSRSHCARGEERYTRGKERRTEKYNVY